MRVAMIGTGYVGLVSGACFAHFGHHVTCVDKDADKIAALSRGEIPIYEPGLTELVRSNIRDHRLAFGTELANPVAAADAVFIAVGTPSRRGRCRPRGAGSLPPSPSQRSRSEPVTRSKRSFASNAPTPTCAWCPTR